MAGRFCIQCAVRDADPVPELLLAQIELFDDLAIALQVNSLEIVEQPAAFVDQANKPSPAVVVFLVHCQVLSQLVDVLGQDRDLGFRRSGIGRRSAELCNEFSFSLLGEHQTILEKCWT